MSIPFYVIAPTTAKVVKPAFTAEKQHLILAVKNELIPTSVPYLVFTSAADYALSFGKDKVYNALVKYFGFLSKSGLSPEKAVIMRWYDEDTAPFAIGGQMPDNGLAELKKITEGKLTVTFDGTAFEATALDFSAANAYSDVATTLQAALQGNTGGGAAFTGATVEYNTTTGGFIITSGEKGAAATIAAFTGEAETLKALGLTSAILSQGVDKEDFSDFCERLADANPVGFTITTLETVTAADMLASAAWLQMTVENQTLYTVWKLAFNFADMDALSEFSGKVKDLSYTGLTLCYDPNGENVNILDAAISASTDYGVENGTKNYNYQPATGYTSVTKYGKVTEYQAGQTNLGVYNKLNGLGASFVYSVGYGDQEQTYYGTGVMLGDFATEDTQANQAGLESDLRLAVINGLNAVEKLKLRGTDAEETLAALVAPSFQKFQKNGAIAYNGELSTTDRISITQSFGSADAADAVESNGYFFRVESLTETDVAEKRRRIRYAYLAGGVINKVVFNASIYGV